MRVTFKEVLLRKFSFKRFEDQIHCQSLGAPWLSCDNQWDLVQNTGNDNKDVLCQRVIHADTLFYVHLLYKLILLVSDNSLEVI